MQFVGHLALLCLPPLCLIFIAFLDYNTGLTSSKEKIGDMMDKDRTDIYDLAPSERYILQFITDGMNFQEIANELRIGIEDLHISISTLMHKRHIKTWHQLTAFAWYVTSLEQQSTLTPEITQDCDEITKGHVEGFCDLYEMLINDHKKICTTCHIGYSYMCNEHRRLQTLKKDWMDKLISNEETKL